MFNIALALAFVLSIHTSFSGRVLAYIIPAEALSSLPSFLKLAINYSVNYWLAATIIYLLLRSVRAECFLKPTKGIHLLLGGANVFIVLYSILRIFTSTIEGGGASFSLINLAGPFIHYVIAAQNIGILWLLVRSVWVKYKVIELPEVRYNPLLKSTSGIVAITMLFPPIVLIGIVYANNSDKISVAVEKRKNLDSRFKKLCETTKADIYQRVDRPKSVYFNTGSDLTILKELEYIEIGFNLEKLQRYTLKDSARDKIQPSANDINREPITELTSRYHVIRSWPKSTDDKKLGISLKNTKIIDSQTNTTLASYSIVKQKKGVRIMKTCPKNYNSRDSNILHYVFGVTNEIDHAFSVKLPE